MYINNINRVSHHGGNRVYNDGDNKVSFQKVERMVVSELVLDRFRAIEVALKMLGEPHPGFWLFTSESLKMDIEIPYNRQVFKYSTYPSAFLWRKMKSDNDHTSLVLTCRDDFSISYPITQLTVSTHGNDTNIRVKEIHNEKDLLDVLDGILHNV